MVDFGQVNISDKIPENDTMDTIKIGGFSESILKVDELSEMAKKNPGIGGITNFKNNLINFDTSKINDIKDPEITNNNNDKDNQKIITETKSNRDKNIPDIQNKKKEEKNI